MFDLIIQMNVDKLAFALALAIYICLSFDKFSSKIVLEYNLRAEFVVLTEHTIQKIQHWGWQSLPSTFL